ncbi:hypothetical protein J7E90_17085 [Streptomyces sp. ISL-111]|uniref:hypothetical protein n=1 Tax=Streptomyces sp. ISL-111 TaxID=2819175 RepID=UPI001BE6C88A|nr:hypothetical protein [Streptomyces sp. ISL-111]MBT2379017.1 hypothetical protein [Streptomyces sp. ISL-111]
MQIVTFGGVTIGLLLLLWALIQWWPGLKPLRKDPAGSAAALLPFLFAWAYGVLAILTVGGLVGWIADTTLWISNWLGDAALVWGVGGNPGQRGPTVAYLPLTQTGGAVVLLLTVVIIAIAKRKKTPAEVKSSLKTGAWCGICLGTSAGVAGFAAVPLAQAANWAGGALYGLAG